MNQNILNEFSKTYDQINLSDNYLIKKWLMVLIDVVLNIHANNSFLNEDHPTDPTQFITLVKQHLSMNIQKLNKCFAAVFMFLYMASVDEKEVIELTSLGDDFNDIYSSQLTLTRSIGEFEDLINNYDPAVIKDFVVDFFVNLYLHIAEQKPEAHLSEYFYNMLSSDDLYTCYMEFTKYINFSVPSFMLFGLLNSFVTTHFQKSTNLRTLLKLLKENQQKVSIVQGVLTKLQDLLKE
jgi:hypothetical protein